MRDNRLPSDERRGPTATGTDGAARRRDPDHTGGGRLVTDGGRPALDVVLEGLSRECDRYILYALAESEVVEFDDLVDTVAGHRSGEPVPSDEVREETRLLLHHARLPKLEGLGIVEYDERTSVVRYRDPPRHFEEFLDLTRELDEA